MRGYSRVKSIPRLFGFLQRSSLPVRRLLTIHWKHARTMSITPLSPASPAVRYGFILTHDTLCHGVIPAEWGGDDDVVLYDTRMEAEFERIDAAEMRSDADREAQMEPETDDEGLFVEEAVLHADGSLTLLNLGRAFTAYALRALTR